VKKGKKMGGRGWGGEGSKIVAIERFFVTITAWQSKAFWLPPVF